VRLLELQNEADSLQACAAIGRTVADSNLRGWAALLPLDPPALAEGLRHCGLPVLRGEKAALALGSLAQIWSAARSLAESVDRHKARTLALELRDRAAHLDASRPRWELPRSQLPKDRTLVMGVVNVTPDSFSDGGRFFSPEKAVEHALVLAEQGADILDIGGESTRPGAEPIGAAEERERVEPVVRELARRVKVPLSIDTSKSEVARAALDAGAEIVNDVSGLARDPQMGEAAKGAAVCLMHMRGTPQQMQAKATYSDLLDEVQRELIEALERACAAGIAEERIALDPGLGFAKTGEQNLLLLRRLRELTQLGRPLVVGASRKSFIGTATGRSAPERLFGSVAASALAASSGASVLRVHDVAATREALAVADAVRTSTA
jgi:dihydropteroate synthase